MQANEKAIAREKEESKHKKCEKGIHSNLLAYFPHLDSLYGVKYLAVTYNFGTSNSQKPAVGTHEHVQASGRPRNCTGVKRIVSPNRRCLRHHRRGTCRCRPMQCGEERYRLEGIDSRMQ